MSADGAELVVVRGAVPAVDSRRTPTAQCRGAVPRGGWERCPDGADERLGLRNVREPVPTGEGDGLPVRADSHTSYVAAADPGRAPRHRLRA